MLFLGLSFFVTAPVITGLVVLAIFLLSAFGGGEENDGSSFDNEIDVDYEDDNNDWGGSGD